MSSDISYVTYTLLAVVAGLIFFPVIFDGEPDGPAMALLQQSSVAPTRKQNESAVHRSRETPTGFPLRQGLGIQEGYTKRKGDVRDIWRVFMQRVGQLHTILGNDKVVHSIDTLDGEIDSLGEYISGLQTAGKRKVVAVYLPNSAENLIAGFTCAFYDFTFVPIQYPAEPEVVEQKLKNTDAEILLMPAACLDLNDLKAATSLKHVILVVEEGSRHLDFADDPNAKVTLKEWHDIAINGKKGTRPETIDESQPHMLILAKNLKLDKMEVIPYSHINIVSAVSAQATALPPKDQFKVEDVFTPASPLADQYTRIITYTAMLSGCTIIVNAVTPPSGPLQSACVNAIPSVIVVPADTLSEVHRTSMAAQVEIFHEWMHVYQLRKLVRYGQVPRQSGFARFNDYDRPNLGKNLRLIYVAENPSEGTKPITINMLNNLRAVMFSKIVYAFTYPPAAAGAITQTTVYDYRPGEDTKMFKDSHVGSPLSCVEVKLRDAAEYTSESPDGPMGEVVIAGPAVTKQGEYATGVIARWRNDGCLALGSKG
ncbi:hypothetical protein H072_3090 [Dactylellina haptotyla CBS 200.50]|uniref:AMP-dependent synthetase/ligase domain-containing protein n=1 Tax=Dactylellina haptotyla (strain CBS 200.50) TaxID=1284197 RepID=S8AIY0_DACHA|nr:hypothetical protein H072_3090 [Dactylellina haptotyla CBS 200.50]